ncbi:VWA domain-containing protein [Corallococcus sp. AB011P]|nr:VWA domain-containing protein [Corallococcus sp. AB011P]RKG56444.1 VWA domain-containing protein [Corallococcus sp. AB011P]
MAALGLLVLAFPEVADAQPSFKEEHVVILLDRSGSMTSTRTDGSTRFQAGIVMARDTVEFTSPDNLPRYFSVWSFEDSTYAKHLAFTQDIQAVLNTLNAIQVGQGVTPLAYAACAAVDELRLFRPQILARKRIQLSSDGEENSSPMGSQCQGADSPTMASQSWQWKVRNKLRTGNAQNENAVPYAIVSDIVFFGSFLRFQPGFVAEPTLQEILGNGQRPVPAGYAVPVEGPFVTYLRMLAEESGGKMRVLDDTAPRPVYGDVNADGCVDMGDYDTVIQNFGLTVPPGDARADVNEDRTVDYGDYAVVMANWGMGGRCALPLRGE